MKHDDLHAYRQLRRIVYGQLDFWKMVDQVDERRGVYRSTRYEALLRFLDYRRRYAPSLTKGAEQ